MENNQLLNLDFNLIDKNLPKNIYGLRILDVDKNKTFDLIIKHDGFCPDNYSERDQSRFNDYLSNLEYSAIQEFFKSIKKRKPKLYSNLIEVMTNGDGDLYHYAKSVS
ncbi:hypothetical protein MG290_02595 [Flavobacterium sp. CBA20B-1]|uniref:hypothetical protein n=1 Tax=unclassified Flavobacterium TaxID=196869 RepID=UPI002224C85F|nr:MULTISPECIES: hypothetical protein [unclassified Flavobacterium]WCM42581.1 hypothetical protein MG290_02595 [Flavobacterium sp. CBA20B-1]